MLKWLINNPLSSKDKEWVLNSLSNIFLQVKQKIDTNQLLKNNSVALINNNNLQKMCLVECFMKDEHRISYIKLSEKKSRIEVDSRNSATEKPDNFFEMVSTAFNDSAWVPQSSLYPEFYPEFATSVELKFDGNTMNALQAKTTTLT